MKRYGYFKLLGRWFTEHIRYIAALLFIFLVFLLNNELYGYRPGAVLYGMLIISFLGVIAGGISFYEYVKRYRKLHDQLEGAEILLEEFPERKGICETLYYLLLERVREEQRMREQSFQKWEKDMTEYYSLWVHQIKTPIAAMQLLLEDEECEGQRLKEELFSIEQYVEMVLHYMRLKGMSEDLTLKEYNVYEIIRQAVRKYTEVFIRKGLSLSFDPFDMKVVTDEKWLLLIMEQLLSNSIKYTKSGGITIRADQEKQKIFISDTGIGIRGEDLPRVFDKGFTGYNGRMDKKSTGIGLYLCKEAAAHLSIRLSVKSSREPGNSGTTFIIDLSDSYCSDVV